MASTYASVKGSLKANPPLPRVHGINLGRSKQLYRQGYVYENPFQPGLACEIFENHDYPHATEQSEACADEPYYHQELPLEEHWYQPELPLENLRELENRLRQEIKQFERNNRKMMIFALQWYYLLEEVEDNEQVEKLFKDLQMIRKLTGSDKV
jgi:hypothetical protein